MTTRIIIKINDIVLINHLFFKARQIIRFRIILILRFLTLFRTLPNWWFRYVVRWLYPILIVCNYLPYTVCKTFPKSWARDPWFLLNLFFPFSSHWCAWTLFLYNALKSCLRYPPMRFSSWLLTYLSTKSRALPSW